MWKQPHIVSFAYYQLCINVGVLQKASFQQAQQIQDSKYEGKPSFAMSREKFLASCRVGRTYSVIVHIFGRLMDVQPIEAYLFTFFILLVARNNHQQKFWVLQLSFATKIQLHVTHAIANFCSCIRQVADDIQLHATLRMQHVYTVLIYMLIHTY